jgi:preprotein translocase subunit SecF
VGKELRVNAILSAIIAMFFILVYVWLRFEMEFAPGAVLCLVHDSIITAGVFSLFGLEIDTSFVAAILTLVGYSINDTIVVYDRIRENMGVLKSEPFGVIINRSINQTLSRTILTSVTVFIIAVVLLIWGGPILFNLSLALTIGVFIGTYSSIYIASPLTLLFHKRLAARQAV